jgi:hypothetical protein
MSASFAIPLSGMNAARTRLAVSAQNIASVYAEDDRRREVALESLRDGGVEATIVPAREPGPALVDDVIGQLIARNQFLANLALFRGNYYRIGSLLDIAV